MSKERLEEIKRIRKNMQEFVDSDGCVVDYPRYDEQALLISDEGHLDWLIEQAERVQELEKDIKEWKIVNESWEEINTVLGRQNKRYREAFRQIELQILFGSTIECHRENIIQIIDEALEGEE